MRSLLPGGEPFLFPGGPIGCLLVHGFTATPQEVRWLGEYLAKEGHTVAGVRLFGHATQPRALNRAQWEDWYASVQDGYHLLAGNCEHVIPMGISLGGALTLILCSQYELPGVVSMATPHHLPFGWDHRAMQTLLALASHIVPTLKKGPGDWNISDAAEARVQYDAYPLAAVGQLIPMLATMRRILPQLRLPTLLIHSRSDGFVPPEHMQAIYDSLGSEQKSMVWVERSNHIVTCDIDRDEVFQTAGAFVQRLSEQWS